MRVRHIDFATGAKYTPAVVAGTLVFTSGQVGQDPASGEVPDEFAAEVHLALDNLERVLVAAGSGLGHLVKVTAYISDVELVETFNRIYMERVPEPRPARATVEVKMLPPYRVELDSVGALG